MVFRIFGSAIREEAVRGEDLCQHCASACIRKGFRGEELILCGAGGTLRELDFAVRECSYFDDRRVVRPARVAGFVKPSQSGGNVTVIKIA